MEEAMMEMGMPLEMSSGTTLGSGWPSEVSSTLTRRYTVEKLTENNYRMWKLRMNLILERAELLDIVSGEETKPTKNPELKEWRRKDLDARMEIIMHLSDDQVDFIKDLETSKEIWDTLKERHEPSDRTTKIYTLRHLVTMEMNESDSIDIFIKNWQSALDAALSAGNKIDEEMKFDLILGSLPDSWDTFITTHGNDKSSNIRDLFVKMRREELRRRKPKFQNDGSTAMAATIRQHGQSTQQSTPRAQQLQRTGATRGVGGISSISTIICRYCHKPGHIERYCRSKRYDQQNRGRKSNPQAHNALITDDEDTSLTDEDTSFIHAFTCHLQAEDEIQLFMAGLQSTNQNLWFLDTGATHHLTHSREWLHDYKMLSKPLEVRFGDNGMKMAIGKGTINLPINSKSTITMTNVYFVPGLAKNLLSVSEATSNGMVLEFHNNHAIIHHKLSSGEEIKTTCPRMGRLYPLKVMENTLIEANMVSSHHEIDPTLLWHHRLGHLHPKSMKASQIHTIMEGIPRKPFNYLPICEGCIYGKQYRQKFPLHTHQSKQPLELVHSDLCGPLQTSSITGNNYFITFIDDYTRFTIVYFLKSKSEAFKAFTSYKALVENQSQFKIKIIRTDNGGEYCSKEWIFFCNTHGIRHEHTIPYNPQQNGVAERKNRTLLDASRSMLQVAGLPNQFWQEAVATTCYLQNRSPHKVLGLHTPYFFWFDKKPQVGHLRIFGAIAYSYIPTKLRKKLDPHSKKCVFVGYGESNGIKGYKLYDPQNKKFFYNRSVTINEEPLILRNLNTNASKIMLSSEKFSKDDYNMSEGMKIKNWKNEHDQAKGATSSPLEDSIFEDKDCRDTTCEFQVELARSGKGKEKIEEEDPLWCENRKYEEKNDEASTSQKQSTSPILPRKEKHRSLREIYEVTKPLEALFVDLHEYNLDNFEEYQMDNLHPTVEEALASKDAAEWKEAMHKEIDALKKNDTWVLIPPPKGKNIISCKWVLTKKCDANGHVTRLKARLVARGFRQVYGVDYNETFAPTLKMVPLRLLLSITAGLNLELHHLDVETAFLHGDLNEEIYMKQPPFFEDSKYPKYVCKLRKSLYGLKQSPRMWHIKLHTYLETIGFKRLQAEPNLYIRKEGKFFVILGVYVDDLPIASNCGNALKKVIDELKDKFPIKDLGPLEFCLGIKVSRNRTEGKLTLSQRKLIEEILEKYDMKDCKPIQTPMTVPCKLSTDDCPKTTMEEEIMATIPYRQILGSIRYLVSCTRPDLSFCAGFLSRFMQNPGLEHWKALKRILRYLQHTKDMVLTYHTFQIQNPSQLNGYLHTPALDGWTDSDWGGDIDTSRSTSGMVFTFAGGAIAWRSKRQSSVALSSTEAEYVAAALTAKEGLWIKTILEELDIINISGVNIYCDNQSCMKLAQNPKITDQNKHIRARHHFIRDLIEDKEMTIHYTSTNTMWADFLTKPVPQQKHYNCCIKLGLNIVKTNN